MKNRACIGTCSGPAEAAFVRSVFEAHEIPVVINGEMHATAMGGLGGFVRLDILVDGDDAEEAAALLADIRAGDHAVSEGDELPIDTEGDERADARGVWDAPVQAQGPAPAGEAALPAASASSAVGFDNRRRRTGIVLLLSVLIGFGTAHMYTRAWGRGIALAVLTLIGVPLVVVASEDVAMGGWLLFASRFVDMFGALWRVWSRPAG